MTDCSDAYWNAEETNLCEQVKEQILPRMRRGEAKHYSVFALAPQPLLIKFGTMINDLQMCGSIRSTENLIRGNGLMMDRSGKLN